MSSLFILKRTFPSYHSSNASKTFLGIPDRSKKKKKCKTLSVFLAPSPNEIQLRAVHESPRTKPASTQWQQQQQQQIRRTHQWFLSTWHVLKQNQSLSGIQSKTCVCSTKVAEDDKCAPLSLLLHLTALEYQCFMCSRAEVSFSPSHYQQLGTIHPKPVKTAHFYQKR